MFGPGSSKIHILLLPGSDYVYAQLHTRYGQIQILVGASTVKPEISVDIFANFG